MDWEIGFCLKTSNIIIHPRLDVVYYLKEVYCK